MELFKQVERDGNLIARFGNHGFDLLVTTKVYNYNNHILKIRMCGGKYLDMVETNKIALSNFIKEKKFDLEYIDLTVL